MTEFLTPRQIQNREKKERREAEAALARAAEAQAKEEAFLALPLFDGTEASCKSREDYYALEGALDKYRRATEAVDQMASYLARKMDDIRRTIRRDGVTDVEQKNSWDPSLSVPPASAAKYPGLNSCGEIQGNGNIDALIMAMHGRREAFLTTARLLGYRLTDKREVL